MLGAWLNVRTNVAGLTDKKAVDGIMTEGARIAADAVTMEMTIREIVEGKIGG